MIVKSGPYLQASTKSTYLLRQILRGGKFLISNVNDMWTIEKIIIIKYKQVCLEFKVSMNQKTDQNFK